jgi:hypothetical protein
MLTQSIRRKPGPVLAVFAAVMSLSGLAEAQQSGLFPLHAVKRERTPCVNEEPIYKLYRNQYYGYFPTQWRRFPDGWSLRSPEGPNTIEELKKNPIEGPKPFAPGEEETPGPEIPIPRPAIPNPPRDERSPFEMDRPEPGAGAAPGAAPPTRTSPAPRGNTSPPADASPFDIPEPKPAAPGDRPQASRPNQPSAPSPTDPPAPDLAPPGAAPPVPPRTSWNRRRQPRQTDPRPILSISDAMLPAIEEASSPADPGGTSGAETVATSSGAGGPAMAPTADLPPQAPRRGPISSLFAGLGFDWLRR